MNRWIDVHTHLEMLEGSPQDSLTLAQQAGVERMITIGTQPEDWPEVLKLAQDYGPQVWCTLGVHPHEAQKYDDAGEKFLRDHLGDPQVVAVGEIGLDHFYEHSPQDIQAKVFRNQLGLAQEFNLPIEIHTRDAEKQTIEILKEFNGKIRGLVHCFSGTQWLADEALALGLNLSISGIVTFPKAEELREVVKSVPLDRLHVETDAPFLTPVPFRGKKNTPALVIHTAQKVAELKGVSLEELARQVRENALKLFPKLRWH